MGEMPLVAPNPWSLQDKGTGLGRGLTPYQRARLALQQQKQNAMRGPTAVPSQPINLDALQDQQQNLNDYGYDPNSSPTTDQLQGLKIAPLANSPSGNPIMSQGDLGNNTPPSNGYDPTKVAALIQQKAAEHGVDPQIALAVARSEGLNAYTGDNGSSFGPFQLHYGGVASGGNSVGGLGDTFTKQTGLDARDPSTVPAQIDFALGQAKAGGWGPWHGWKGDPSAGLNANVPPMQQNTPVSQNDVPLPPQRPDDLPQQTADNDTNGDTTDPTSGLSWLL